MSSFASKTPVKVTVDSRPDEFVAVRSKLSVEAKGVLQDALMTVDTSNAADPELHMHAGRYVFAVLQSNVVGWRLKLDPESGLEEDPNDPGYVRFKPEYIGQMDEEDDLVSATLVKIVELNPTLGQARKPNANG